MVIRCVIDTNVFVGACLGKGACSTALALCLQGRVQPFMGSTLLAEYEAVLGRDALFQACRLRPDERSELLDIFLARCEWTRVYFGWRPNVPDESDNHLVELAVAGRASHVVSRNLRDLNRAELIFPGLTCLSPEAFINGVEAP